MQSIPSRVQKFLLRRLTKGRGVFATLRDERQTGKVKHPLAAIASALLLGLLSNRRTLRDVEALTETLQGPWRKLVPKTISDTTLDTVLRQLSDEQLQQGLVVLNRELKRSKLLKQAPGLAVRLVVVDGKNLATLDHDAQGTAQARSDDNKKWQRKDAKQAAYGLTPALRACLASTEARPCLLQMPLDPKTNETASFKTFLQLLRGSYGRSNILDVLSMDAGLTSLSNANAVVDDNLRYIFGLKANQTELFSEAKRLLEKIAAERPPESESAWQRRGSKTVRRQLWRTADLRGFENSVGTWSHLDQTWLVRQTTRDGYGNLEVEDRYFLSSIPWEELAGWQILQCVRLHWDIENDVFNSLDVQWREDSGTWCTKGTAVWALGVLRLIAYNIVQALRRRNCRRKRGRHTWLDPLPWRTLFEHIFDALRGHGLMLETA